MGTDCSARVEQSAPPPARTNDSLGTAARRGYSSISGRPFQQILVSWRVGPVGPLGLVRPNSCCSPFVSVSLLLILDAVHGLVAPNESSRSATESLLDLTQYLPDGLEHPIDLLALDDQRRR